MKIILLGYGKMGKEIEKIALDRKHEIILKVDENNHSSITKEQLSAGDVAIEFSTPHTVIENIYKCFYHSRLFIHAKYEQLYVGIILPGCFKIWLSVFHRYGFEKLHSLFPRSEYNYPGAVCTVSRH